MDLGFGRGCASIIVISGLGAVIRKTTDHYALAFATMESLLEQSPASSPLFGGLAVSKNGLCFFKCGFADQGKMLSRIYTIFPSDLANVDWVFQHRLELCIDPRLVFSVSKPSVV